MQVKCPCCGYDYASSMPPFAYIYCRECKFDEEFDNIEKYKIKLKGRVK